MKPQLIDVHLVGSKTIHIKTIEQQFLNTPFHFHQLCELVWIEKSYGKRIIGDSVDYFEDDDFVLMGLNLPHIWQCGEIFYRVNSDVI